MEIRKAIITAGGYGSRFLPITKSIQKEMLPIMSKPVISYLVDDLAKAGIAEIIFVVNEKAQQLKDYYSSDSEMMKYLKRNGKTEEYEKMASISHNIKFSYVQEQPSDPYGTAIPVLIAKEHVQNEDAFFVYMGDDFIFNADGSNESAKMLELMDSAQADGVITAIEQPEADLHKYGVLQTKEERGFRYLEDIVEKPEPGQAPSNLANNSKYILNPKVIEIIEKQNPDPRHGEYMVTDSIAELAKTDNIAVHIPNGQYLDAGNPKGWLKANLTIAMQDEEMRDVVEKVSQDKLD